MRKFLVRLYIVLATFGIVADCVREVHQFNHRKDPISITAFGSCSFAVAVLTLRDGTVEPVTSLAEASAIAKKLPPNAANEVVLACTDQNT